MTIDRRATFGPVAGDPTLWVIRCDASLNYVIGRFAVARFDQSRRGFLVKVEHVELFRSFARMNRILLDDPPVTGSEMPTYSPPAFRRDAADPNQTAINKRGVTICRAMIARARMIKARDHG